MCMAKAMANTYEANRSICKYVHSTSRGHEAIQLALAYQLLPIDYVSPYYRDESILLGLGFSPYSLMLQLLAKAEDPFTAGRAYYSHPNFRSADQPTIIHQSSATGMQVIPTTGVAQGLQYLRQIESSIARRGSAGEQPIAVCSLGDASVTEGEVSEAFQFAVLKKLPILYLVQDNQWGISVRKEEARVMTAVEYAQGFPGMKTMEIDGSDFEASYAALAEVFASLRQDGGPWLVQAHVPLLGHHTSGVRKEFYRTEEDLSAEATRDAQPKLRKLLLDRYASTSEALDQIEAEMQQLVSADFLRASSAPEPDPSTVSQHVFAPTPVVTETGNRNEQGGEKVMMVDAALFAIREIMEEFPEALLYGQDVGRRLGGVFREAATLAEQFGDHRVFNTAIQEAYIIGSTVGMSAVGTKPIVEIQFADYIYPGINQLVTEISKSCYLSAGKFPIQTLIRVPIGAYGGGGPYHSGSIESTLLSIKGIKVVYPSNAADMKGLMKAAFLDPNPVVMLEHKGLYWSKVPGTEAARTAEPDRDYILPLGKARVVQAAAASEVELGNSCVVITYGMGVYWALAASKALASVSATANGAAISNEAAAANGSAASNAQATSNALDGRVEIIDLRTLAPLDEPMIEAAIRKHGKCLMLTEEQQSHSFMESLAGRMSHRCFQQLDAPIEVMGALDLPAVPMNTILEQAMLPNAHTVMNRLKVLLEA